MTDRVRIAQMAELVGGGETLACASFQPAAPPITPA